MREIKFQAWDGEKMVSPDYIDRYGVAWWKENSIPTRSKDVMQFTGLKDKNGKEIWEGSIVRYKVDGNDDNVGDVVWNNPAGGYYINIYPRVDNEPIALAIWVPEEIEVIGNIHENRNLLK